MANNTQVARAPTQESKFLLNHFLIAWRSAVYNCKMILDGLIDLTQQKAFVSSLQNALELGCKQVMIDESYYKVIDYGKMNPDVASAYLQSADLNAYFNSLTKEEYSNLYSCAFNTIMDYFVKNKKGDFQISLKTHLKTLQELRNNETHFYIDESNYLSFDDFKKLCELMDAFYKYFHNCHYFKILGKPSDGWETSLQYFDVSEYELNSYDTFVVKSRSNKTILDNLSEYNTEDKGEGCWLSYFCHDDDYELAYSLYNQEVFFVDESNYKMNFNEFYRRFAILHKKDIIHVETYSEEFDIFDEEGNVSTNENLVTVITKKATN